MALDAGWQLTVRCAWGKREAMKTVRECISSHRLDLATLVWTRGRAFPLWSLESRLKCPRCGSRRVFPARGSEGRREPTLKAAPSSNH